MWLHSPRFLEDRLTLIQDQTLTKTLSKVLFSYKRMFFTVYIFFCSLRLFQLKTGRQAIQTDKVTEKLQNSIKISLVSGFEQPSPLLLITMVFGAIQVRALGPKVSELCSQFLSPPRCINDTNEFHAMEQPWDRTPSHPGESRNTCTPSSLTIQKPG